MKVLIAEDEKDLAKAIKTILVYSGYETSVVYNGLDAVNLAKQEAFDVIILDIMMPVMDGLEATKKIREDLIDTPIILLTAKSTVDDKVEGLDSGANDYLTKPFDKKELLARIRAQIRTSQKSKEYNVGNLVFDKENLELSSSKASFKLNSKECELMEILVKNQDRSIPIQELSKKVWQTEELQEPAVNMYISYLQDKFTALEANVKINNENGYILEKLG